MKNKVSAALKQMLAALSAMAKSKSLALRRKTNALRTRLIIFSLLHHNKKFFVSTLSHKLQSILSHRHHHHEDKLCEEAEDADVVAEQPSENAIVNYCNSEALVHEPMPIPTHYEPAKDEEEEEEEDDDDDDDAEVDEKYPDLRHTLFDGIENSGGSVIELVKHSKEDRGEEFVLENEIDHVADLFIRRFHRRMRLQKMESFKNYQEMLQRGV